MILATGIAESARSQTIESLVSPGELAEAHADLQTECSACHMRFDRGRQRELCIECHEDVGIDIDRELGFHGRSTEVRGTACADCHTDHEGAGADIANLDEDAFDHDITDFRLQGRHVEAACDGCHAADIRRRDAPSDCIDCHNDDDVHDGFAGNACGDCHKENDWKEISFDHDVTDYPLIGKHREVTCNDCHEDRTFRTTPTTCYGCHVEDDAHDGRSGDRCENCHNPKSWQDSSFDHARDTSFLLDGSHAELTCNDCHSEDPFSDRLETACASCHLEDDHHEGHFGEECDTCHATSLWTVSHFDHDRDTEYALRGAHTTIECEACHIEPIFEVILQTSCSDCHADDDPHKGEQGIRCDDCHNESSWQDDVLFDHDLTRFPLLGRHPETECGDCHETHVFRDAPELCVECHGDDDPHGGRFTDDCGACHNPVDWLAWQFDHGLRTDFPLEGAHADTACDACHRQPLAAMERMGGRCGDCHRSDDVHDGEFGFDCGRCHSADSFSNVETIQ